MPPVLTIAGSDSSGGAGIQADLKTFTALGTYGMSVITALTAQNTTGVHATIVLPPEFIQAQLEAVFNDTPPKAIKTGMLANREIIRSVRSFLEVHALSISLVIDPVMIATSGARLLEPDAEEELRNFCNKGTIVTPNLPEAAALLGTSLPTSEKEARALGEALSITYPQPFWLVKGGHAPWEKHTVTNWVFQGGKLFQRLVQTRQTLPRPTHGTGCMLASAIAAYLAHGYEPIVAILSGLDFIQKALSHADLSLGKAAVIPNPSAALCK
ncbi:MAG: bifunctional hydroxymethylpyrimidine kinase/phosphomethylpyrimidine kinase [Bacteroidia bacterium]|nr:bifunctional hydroxymethylpyrimidine kinase/phosphomethylpyrimidine kinase [Bacteroidia bacterium]MDW8134361.1 bifunctional hydroxymethylpyrimidine kinase/phosphomethylpyrimidine kinase [Bacteroidia bacterium]